MKNEHISISYQINLWVLQQKQDTINENYQAAPSIILSVDGKNESRYKLVLACGLLQWHPFVVELSCKVGISLMNLTAGGCMVT